MPISNTDELLLCNVHDLCSNEKPDLDIWSEFYYGNIVVTNVMLLDRYNKITMPYKFHKSEEADIPPFDNNFSQSYEEICNNRARWFIEYSTKLNLPIYIMYSGGIDSTLMLVSFFKTTSYADLKDRIVIALTAESIKENPVFYKKYIQGKFLTVNSEKFNTFFDKTKIILGGEHNDQLFGTDIIAKINQVIPFEKALEPYNKNYILKYFIHSGMQETKALWWYNMLIWHAKQAPCEITTNYQVLWWLNFCFKWQSVFYRILLRVCNEQKANINRDFISKYFFHFYSTENFQQWAMHNNHLKILKEWSTYKYEAKRLIYEFDNNKDYYDNKSKIGSLFRLFLHRNTDWGLTNNFQYIDKFDANYKDLLYVPSNSFLNDYG